LAFAARPVQPGFASFEGLATLGHLRMTPSRLDRYALEHLRIMALRMT